jgi:hypothetical protein
MNSTLSTSSSCSIHQCMLISSQSWNPPLFKFGAAVLWTVQSIKWFNLSYSFFFSLTKLLNWGFLYIRSKWTCWITLPPMLNSQCLNDLHANDGNSNAISSVAILNTLEKRFDLIKVGTKWLECSLWDLTSSSIELWNVQHYQWLTWL